MKGERRLVALSRSLDPRASVRRTAFNGLVITSSKASSVHALLNYALDASYEIDRRGREIHINRY